jgi:hypothetical protein
MSGKKLEINIESIKNELKPYEDKPYLCLFEYIWNAFDANATKIWISFDKPNEGFGDTTSVKIKDNGCGWNFDDENITKYFLSSQKRPNKYKTFPHGHYGRGRYSFIWIADSVRFLSNNKFLKLRLSTDIEKGDVDYLDSGTEAILEGLYSSFSNAINSENLQHELILEFGWLLKEHPEYDIYINGEKLDISSFIEEEKIIQKENLPEEIKNEITGDISIVMVAWKERLSEYSKFYFLNENGDELYKQNTGMNKKKDDFWHSVYIKSSLFKCQFIPDRHDNSQISLSFENKEDKKIESRLKKFLNEQLILFRKPFLQKNAEKIVSGLKSDGLLPALDKFGIYDEKSYDDLLKVVYTISPSSFVGKNDNEKKFFCATLASLLSSQEDNLIQLLLEQVQKLTEDEKKDLQDILKRTSLSNVVRTIKEIDHRLDVIEKLESLLFAHKKETLEVVHLQKILDENFWIFGEQFRLFSTTEGALKKTLTNYAKKILEIDNPEISDSATGELDLFLTKTENAGEHSQKNIVVELKRPSIKLGKKEYDQIYGYMEKIQAEGICNGVNQSWEFYLIGTDYDSHIKNQHNNAKNYGEINRGLTCSLEDGRFKIYVRKWSDILEVEWKSKMKCLKEKLQIQSKQMPKTSQEITDSLTM